MTGRASQKGTGATKTWSRDRAATDRALMDAALRLLARDGVLAGLSMQEVAREAGVNRGNIHHNFGGRRALLRAALDWALQLFAPTYESSRGSSPAFKGKRNWQQLVADQTYPRLVTLLALDGDDKLEPLPYAERRIEDIERERAAGVFEGDPDALAMVALWDATMYGYFVIREAAARQLGVTVRELDRRVWKLIASEWESLMAPNLRQ